MKKHTLTDSNQSMPAIEGADDVLTSPGIICGQTVWFRYTPSEHLTTWVIHAGHSFPTSKKALEYSTYSQFEGKLTKSVLKGVVSRAKSHIHDNDSTQAMRDLEILVAASELVLDGDVEALKDIIKRLIECSNPRSGFGAEYTSAVFDATHRLV